MLHAGLPLEVTFLRYGKFLIWGDQWTDQVQVRLEAKDGAASPKP